MLQLHNDVSTMEKVREFSAQEHKQIIDKLQNDTAGIQVRLGDHAANQS